MTILTKREEKCLQCFATIGMILTIASETFNTVINRKIDRVNKEIIYRKDRLNKN